MALTFYGHPLSSYCWKVLTALYENDTAFDYRLLDGDPARQAELLALWPIGKFPVLVDRGRLIVESSTIIEHLALHHRGARHLVPADADAAIEARMMDRIFDNEVMTPMQIIVGDRLRPAEARDPYGVERARARLETVYGWLEARLSDRAWAGGEDFTMADCAAAPSLHYADKVQPLGGRFPILANYQARLEARPSVARVLAEAAPYAAMFPTAD